MDTTLQDLEGILADYASAHDDDEIRAECGITFGAVRNLATLAGLRAESRDDKIALVELDKRAESILHEAVAKLLWLRTFHRDYRCSWEEGKKSKEWSTLYVTTSDAYLTASEIISLVRGCRGVLAEVKSEIDRQKLKGYIDTHDDKHRIGDLAKAASAYSLASTETYLFAPLVWPWPPEAWRPEAPRTNLLKSAALSVRAIERMDRDRARRDPPSRVPDRLPPSTSRKR